MCWADLNWALFKQRTSHHDDFLLVLVQGEVRGVTSSLFCIDNPTILNLINVREVEGGGRSTGCLCKSLAQGLVHNNCPEILFDRMRWGNQGGKSQRKFRVRMWRPHRVLNRRRKPHSTYCLLDSNHSEISKCTSMLSTEKRLATWEGLTFVSLEIRINENIFLNIPVNG